KEAPTQTCHTAMRFTQWVKLCGGFSLIRCKVRSMLLDASGDLSWVTEGVVSGYTMGEARDFGATLKTFLAMSRAREPAKLAPRLGDIACPVTLLVGTAHHDGDVPAQEVALMTHAIQSFEVDSERGAGH